MRNNTTDHGEANGKENGNRVRGGVIGIITEIKVIMENEKAKRTINWKLC